MLKKNNTTNVSVTFYRLPFFKMRMLRPRKAQKCNADKKLQEWKSDILAFIDSNIICSLNVSVLKKNI